MGKTPDLDGFSWLALKQQDYRDRKNKAAKEAAQAFEKGDYVKATEVIMDFMMKERTYDDS